MTKLDQLLAELTSGNEPRAESAAVQFVSLGQPGLEALVHLASHEDKETRWWALRALSEFSSPEVSPVLVAALHDSDVEVQTCAALALRHQPVKSAIPALILLLGHSESLLSRVARDALIAIGKDATQPLIAIIEDGDSGSHHARLEAVRALAEIKDPEAIATLFRVYQEGSSLMQHWAEKGLENMGIGMVFFDPN